MAQLFRDRAFATQLWFDRHAKKDHRVTRDIDLVIGVPAYGAYHALRDRLATDWPRVQATRNRHTLILEGGVVLDLLPFEDEVFRSDGQAYEAAWSGPRELVGFQEVAQRGTTIYHVDGIAIRSATVPAIIGLKLIALDDRPDERLKDADDIGRLIFHYSDLEDNNIWDNHYDLFEPGVEMAQAGHIALGREVYTVFRFNPALTDRMAAALERIIAGERPGLQWIAMELKVEGTEVCDVLRRFLHGFRQNWTSTTS